MRQEYIEELVLYLKTTDLAPKSISEIKEKALIWGATEEEFAAALTQAKTHNFRERNEVQNPKENGKIITKLIQLDLVLHAVLLFFVLGLAIFLFQTLKPSEKTITKPEGVSIKPVSLIPPVYATSVAVDAAQIFSYPTTPITLSISGKPKREIYGYFPYWMLEQEEEVSLDTITTLSYFGLTVNGSGSIITRYSDGSLEKGWQSWSNPTLLALVQRAKQKNIHLELTLKSFDNSDIEQLVQSDDSQKIFIANAIQLIQAKAFDGINLDFEFTGTPTVAISTDFTRLVINLKSEMQRQIPDATLTISTYINEAAVPRLVDIEALSDEVDSFVIMGYDFHTPNGEAGPIAPLNGQVSIIGYMQSYLEKVPANKLILALPHYGYDWKENGSPEEHRIIPYAIAVNESRNNNVKWDSISQTPWYSYKDKTDDTTRTVHFENIRSLGLKYDYINKKDLKGVGIWALGYDGNESEIQLLLREKFISE